MFINSYTIYISIGFAKLFRGIILVNAPLVILFTCKKIISYFSNTILKHIIPFDHFPYYHRFTGYIFIFASILHSLAHCIGTIPFIVNSDLNELNKKLYTPFKTLPTWWELCFIYPFGWTGIAILVLFAVLLITVHESIRKNNFECFFFLHQLSYLIYPLGYIHGTYNLVGTQLFHIMCGGPFVLLLLENFIKFLQYCFSNYEILDIKCLSSGVVQMTISLKDSYMFKNMKPGQYISICIPEISCYQIHPITISGIYDNNRDFKVNNNYFLDYDFKDQFFTLHIAPVGWWSKELQHISKAKYKEKLVKLESHINNIKIHDETHRGKLVHLLKASQLNISKEGCVKDIQNIEYSINDDSDLSIEIKSNENDIGKNIKIKSKPLAKSILESANKINYYNSNLNNINNYDLNISSILINRLLPINFPKAKLFGPYGAPTQKYTDFIWLVFIASGIGATPFASILNNIILSITKNPDKRIKVQFYWMQRQAHQFNWLIELIKQIMKVDVNNKIEFNVFYTCPYQKYDFRSFLLWHGLQLCKNDKSKYERVNEIENDNIENKENEKHIDIKGFNKDKELKNKTLNNKDLSKYCKNVYWARPNWNDVFESLVSDKFENDCGVFVCGNSSLCKEILSCCEIYSNKSLRFWFYKENF